MKRSRAGCALIELVNNVGVVAVAARLIASNKNADKGALIRPLRASQTLARHT